LNEGNFEIIQYIDNVAQVLRLSTGTDPESVRKRALLKDKLVELYKAVFSSNVNFINGDLRRMWFQLSQNCLENQMNQFWSIFKYFGTFKFTFNVESENGVHTVESLPEEVGKQAVSAISNLIEASDKKIKLK
jgi:hypothetical protein